MHVPGLDPLQVWQSVVTPPPHELVQHTESTHVSACGFWLHIALRLHDPPTPCTGEHVPVLQKNPVGQSVSTVQAPWHAVFVPLQGMAAPHEAGVCVGQLPPLHATAGVAWAFGTVPVHVAGFPHGVPFATGVWHKPVKQVSRVQTLLSLPQPVPSATLTFEHPVAGTQESVVQGLLSLQIGAAPPWHTPPTH